MTAHDEADDILPIWSGKLPEHDPEKLPKARPLGGKTLGEELCECKLMRCFTFVCHSSRALCVDRTDSKQHPCSRLGLLNGLCLMCFYDTDCSCSQESQLCAAVTFAVQHCCMMPM